MLVSPAAGLVIYPLIQGRKAGWPAWTYVSMAAAVVILKLYERRRSATASPCYPSLFRKRAFSAASHDAGVLRR